MPLGWSTGWGWGCSTNSSFGAHWAVTSHSGCNHNPALKSCKLTQKETKVTKDLVCFFSKRGWRGEVSIFRHVQQAQSSCSPHDMLLHSSAWTKEGRKFYVCIWENIIAIAIKGCRIKKMQYRLCWYLVPLTRTLFSAVKTTYCPGFGYFQYHRAQGSCTAHENWGMQLKMYSSACLDSVRKFNFPFGFSWELSLSFRCMRALAPKGAWKRVKLCVPYIKTPQPSSSCPISNQIKSSWQHLLWHSYKTGQSLDNCHSLFCW